jgi:hypothetical protein
MGGFGDFVNGMELRKRELTEKLMTETEPFRPKNKENL